ncbi:MAG TPA: hypothetical protein VNT79_08225 [Phycisphaerae bacterium]|nr:hypothetical protein [Phycisphaerae bacterium]
MWNYLPETAAFVEDQVRRGAFSRPEEMIVAAIETLRADIEFGDFAPRELDRLLEAGERSGDEDGWFSGEDARRALIARLERLRNAPK